MSTPTTPARRDLAGMLPAQFALVMATGIVSIAAQSMGMPLVSRALFALNLVFYPGVWALTVARIVRHRARVLSDLADHKRSFGFFTAVAATNVLGSQCLLIGGLPQVAFALWIVGIALWATLTYAIFTILTVKTEKPGLAEGINGGWLVAVVAPQSVVVLGAELAIHFAVYAEPALFFAYAMWLGGGVLYLWIIALIFYRYLFFELSPSDLAPPYWINMGAVAITTLAGATLVHAAPASSVVRDALPFVRGLTVLWWSTATWWIPMLVLLGIWRHGFRRFPLRYDAQYWSAVFPLGMYTVATVRLADVLGAPYLMTIPRVFVYVALTAWSITLFGFFGSLLPSSSPVR